MRRLTGKKTRRLTGKKIKRPISNLDLIERLCSREEAETISIQNAFSKLSKIEDLEEQIGMSLEFILKEIIGKYIYYLHESNYVDYVDCELATGLSRERHPLSDELGDWQIDTDSFYIFKMSEYKKTWWLSEEEAEKKLEENN